MKSMTYAQKADLVAKCKRVFESVKRSNQVAMAESYNNLAVKYIGDEYQLASHVRLWASEMHSRINNKPRYRYDNRAGKWVECKARNLYVKSTADHFAEFQRKQNAYFSSLVENAAMQNTLGGRNPFHPYIIGPGAIGGFY